MQNAEHWDVDLVNFKVFALLMCPGKPKDKASILFDLVYGPTRPGKKEKLDSEKTITWLN